MIKASHFSALLFILGAVFSGCGRTESPQRANLSSEPTPCAGTEITEKLHCIHGLTFTEVTEAVPVGYRRFDIQFEQPVDHTNPGSATFSQKLILMHRSSSDPMLLQTSGYAIFAASLSKVALTLGMNQLQVEHRFFAGSIPLEQDRDWTKLNITQSAADFHAITVAFKEIYDGRWLNTGASKGGMTSIYHRRFYPGDLDGTLAYVAPLSFSTADERYVTFVDQAGGATWAACRAKLARFQRTLLTRREELEASMTGTYNQLGSTDIAFEHAVIELPFAFWQYQSPTSVEVGCDHVPEPNAPLADVSDFLSTVNSPQDGYSDEGVAGFIPYYFQAASQLGGPGAKLSHIADLLQHASTYQIDQYIPSGLPYHYDDAAAMLDVEQWVATQSRTMMFVYGEFDPWSAGAFSPRALGGSVKYIVPGGNHGSNIFQLTAADSTASLNTLKHWLDLDEAEALVSPNREARGGTAKTLEDLEMAAKRGVRL